MLAGQFFYAPTLQLTGMAVFRSWVLRLAATMKNQNIYSRPSSFFS